MILPERVHEHFTMTDTTRILEVSEEYEVWEMEVENMGVKSVTMIICDIEWEIRPGKRNYLSFKSEDCVLDPKSRIEFRGCGKKHIEIDLYGRRV